MQDQVVLDGFPLDHEFSEDYGLEEDDDMNIDGEPLFEEELANQITVGAKPKRKSKRTKAYTPAEDKLLCASSFGGIQAVEDHGDGEKARPRGKNNSKKEDRRNATLIALLEKVEGMISKNDLRKEKRRQEKEEQMHAFMKIQRRRLEMDAERQAKMLELEEAKQAKIEATNAMTKAKEVALASMKTGAEIMKFDLNTVSSRKRLWFEKMQGEMLKFVQL
ncbi:Helicase SKI2W [Hordeum vulgare]|nr:Helicase SKI2W [Hordeum vulgare]